MKDLLLIIRWSISDYFTFFFLFFFFFFFNFVRLNISTEILKLWWFILQSMSEILLHIHEPGSVAQLAGHLTADQRVTGHFVPRSFRTQVISYHFGHFIPTFIFDLVISYPVWSFRTQFSHFVLFSRKPFWSFRTYFLLFRTQVILYPKSFRPILVISYPLPNYVRTDLDTKWLFCVCVCVFCIFAVICYFQTRYELTLVWNDFLFFLL